MDFVDYYAVLNLPLTARAGEVQKSFEDLFASNVDPTRFSHAITACSVLTNPYKRARYNQEMGHLLVVQIKPQPYLSAKCYQINSIQPFVSLQALIEKFKSWIENKYDFTWEEALESRYSYHLHVEGDKSYLMMRFPQENVRQSFIKHLEEQKIIRMRDDD